jgi:hypothetical protein
MRSSELGDNQKIAHTVENVIPTGTMMVEGCEYISLPGKYGFSHKGNCKNSIHGKGYFYPSKLITCKKCGAEMVENGEKCR